LRCGNGINQQEDANRAFVQPTTRTQVH
jgi:hypothetical protein